MYFPHHSVISCRSSSINQRVKNHIFIVPSRRTSSPLERTARSHTRPARDLSRAALVTRAKKPKMARQTSRLTSSDRSMLKLQIVRTFPCRSLRGSLSKASRQVGGWDGSVTHTVTDSRFSRKGLNVNCSGSRLTGVTLPKHLVYTNKKGLKLRANT